MRDFSRIGEEYLTLNSTVLHIKYFAFPGATYEKFVVNPALLNPLIAYGPTVIVLILGGNDFYKSVSNNTIHCNYESVVTYLKQKIPSFSLIPCQIEKRFVGANNRWDFSATELFEKRRAAFNRKLNKCPHKHCIVRVQGPGNLNDRSNYARDGIHLSEKGLTLYWDFIVFILEYYLLSIPKNG